MLVGAFCEDEKVWFVHGKVNLLFHYDKQRNCFPV